MGGRGAGFDVGDWFGRTTLQRRYDWRVGCAVAAAAGPRVEVCRGGTGASGPSWTVVAKVLEIACCRVVSIASSWHHPRHGGCDCDCDWTAYSSAVACSMFPAPATQRLPSPRPCTCWVNAIPSTQAASTPHANDAASVVSSPGTQQDDVPGKPSNRWEVMVGGQCYVWEMQGNVESSSKAI